MRCSRIDVAATFGFASPNAVTIGFLLAHYTSFNDWLTDSIKVSDNRYCGFYPIVFDNAVIAVYANNRGGVKAACLFPFLSGLIQVGGSALFATWIDYLNMAVIWACSIGQQLYRYLQSL